MLGRRRSQRVELWMPGLETPPLHRAPSLRIMDVANRRAWAYGLAVAIATSWSFNALMAFLVADRLEPTPYVADGSTYGCSPTALPQRGAPPGDAPLLGLVDAPASIGG